METNEGAVLGWQPIETAPKIDGNAILSWDGHNTEVIEWWDGGANPRLACWQDGHGITWAPRTGCHSRPHRYR